MVNKHKIIKSVVIVNEYKITQLDKKIINAIKRKILSTNLKDNYSLYIILYNEYYCIYIICFIIFHICSRCDYTNKNKHIFTNIYSFDCIFYYNWINNKTS